MSKIDRLIEKLCPNGVECIKLSEISDYLSGMTGVSNKWKENGNCLFVDYMNVYKHLKVDVNNISSATVTNSDKQTIVKKGDILFTSASETPDECAISAVIEDEIQDGIFMDDHLFGIRFKDEYNKKINSTYLNYFCHSKNFRKKVDKTVRGVTRFYISKNEFMDIQVPVPPLEIQEEIVRILDSFTELEEELEEELEGRRKQYSYYRDQLLNFDLNEKIEYKPLGKITKVMRGSRLTKSQLSDEGYPVYHGALEPLGYYHNYNRDGDTVIVVNTGSIGEVGYSKDKFWCSDGCFTIQKCNELNNRFLFHYLAKCENYFKSRIRKGGVPTIDKDTVETIKVPIPPLEIQEKIVNVLDNFDQICSDLNVGLPAEIEARKKQYEYYRDELFAFKELEN